MTPGELEKKYYAAFNARDFAAYGLLLTADCQLTAPGGVALQGVEAIQAFDRAWTEAFPDARVSFDAQAAGHGSVASRNRFTGTQTGIFHAPGGEVPPTGRRVDAEFVAWMDLRGDRCGSFRLYFDQLELMTQLGLFPGG